MFFDLHFLFKGLLTVDRELRQQHPSDLLRGVVAVTPDRPWSIPIITWQNNFIYEKIRSKSLPNLAPSPTCLHRDVTYISLTTGIVALHIPSWRTVSTRNVARHVKRCGQLMQEEWFVAIEIIYMESPVIINMFKTLSFKSKSQVWE